MKRICITLILSVALPLFAGPSARQVLCRGNLQVQDFSSKAIDKGAAAIGFQLVDANTIRNIKLVSKFRKQKPQRIEAVESKAMKRAVASGRFKADFFNIGHNGACQMGLAYQGDLAARATKSSSWGVLMMMCGAYGATGNLKCEMK